MTQRAFNGSIFLCDVALFFLLLQLGRLVIVPLSAIEVQRQCRMTFETIAEYSALAEVCRDRAAARAIVQTDRLSVLARAK